MKAWEFMLTRYIIYLGRKFSIILVWFTWQLLGDGCFSSSKQSHLPVIICASIILTVKRICFPIVRNHIFNTWWPSLTRSLARNTPINRVPPIIRIFFSPDAVTCNAPFGWHTFLLHCNQTQILQNTCYYYKANWKIDR